MLPSTCIKPSLAVQGRVLAEQRSMPADRAITQHSFQAHELHLIAPAQTSGALCPGMGNQRIECWGVMKKGRLRALPWIKQRQRPHETSTPLNAWLLTSALSASSLLLAAMLFSVMGGRNRLAHGLLLHSMWESIALASCFQSCLQRCTLCWA